MTGFSSFLIPGCIIIPTDLQKKISVTLKSFLEFIYKKFDGK